MAVWGIARVKDELDVLPAIVAHMLTQVDRLLIADNGSTDGTLEYLRSLTDRVVVRDDPDVGYYQARKMTALAADAGQMGAAFVVPFDADEWWYSPHGRIADVLAEHPEASVATAKLYDHVATAEDPEGDPVSRIGWRRRDPAPLPKVAARPYPRLNIHQGNHGCDYGQTAGGLLVVRHFPYRDVSQFVSKVSNGAAAYKATDLPEDVGAHWRQYGQLLESGGEAAIAEVFRAWFWSPDPRSDPTLIFDPCPV